VDLTYFNADGIGQNNEIKYTVNLANAKSVFRFDCPNGECVGGDFDLSQALTTPTLNTALPWSARRAARAGQQEHHRDRSLPECAALPTQPGVRASPSPRPGA